MDVGALWQELDSTLTVMLLGFRSRLDRLDVAEKADRTLLTEADLAVQEHIVSAVMAYDLGATIVAEETGIDRGVVPASDRIWVVDPIDGTAEFVRPEHVEYCSVVCLLENRQPTAALIVAPEIGPERSPVTVRVDALGSPITVNGKTASVPTAASPRRASVTRSADSTARPWEQQMAAAGFELKTRTTSQTLDMVRSCVDLVSDTGADLPPFALFYRERQKVWDGAAGMCLAQVAGLDVCDSRGQKRTVIDLDLTVPEPTFDATLVASPTLVNQFVVWAAD
jgi:3'(2'), 5'-bisphosphate nucleotidase